jgi:hypothetical protein
MKVYTESLFEDLFNTNSMRRRLTEDFSTASIKALIDKLADNQTALNEIGELAAKYLRDIADTKAGDEWMDGYCIFDLWTADDPSGKPGRLLDSTYDNTTALEYPVTEQEAFDRIKKAILSLTAEEKKLVALEWTWARNNKPASTEYQTDNGGTDLLCNIYEYDPNEWSSVDEYAKSSDRYTVDTDLGYEVLRLLGIRP